MRDKEQENEGGWREKEREKGRIRLADIVINVR